MLRLIHGFMAAERGQQPLAKPPAPGLRYGAGRKKRCSAQWAVLRPKMTPCTVDQR